MNPLQIRKSKRNIWNIDSINTNTEFDTILREINQQGTDKCSRVVYLGRIPHGFYEKEMKAYFSQFGKVTRLRLSRNKKNGASKHYAFVEFEHSEVAEIVAKTMDQYLLKNCLLQCRIVPTERLHKDIWKGADKRFRPLPLLKWAREKHNRERTSDQREKRMQRIEFNNKEKKELLQQLGISYDFPVQSI